MRIHLELGNRLLKESESSQEAFVVCGYTEALRSGPQFECKRCYWEEVWTAPALPALTYHGVNSPEDSFVEVFAPGFIWALGVKLRSSGVRQAPLPDEPAPRPHPSCSETSSQWNMRPAS